MKNFGAKIKNLPWKYICPIITVLLFFSFCAILTYDSGHYLSYVSIFEGNSPASSWDIVRGPVFPIIIHSFNILFGKTNTGLLVGLFIYYLIFSLTCYKTCQEICQHYKHKKIIETILVIVLLFNPLIFGYFHVLLTEFVAITLTLLNILIAYKWIFIDPKRKNLILYSLYFIFSILFCYHLKQPYIIISFIPPLVAAIISIFINHQKKNILYRISTLVVSLVILLISIFSWNGILKSIGANDKSGRDSSSMLGKQLLLAYQIPYDNNNDGEIDRLSTGEAIGLILNQFSKNPLHTFKIYTQNYCGLSSMCEITTNNGYDFYSTSRLVGLSTYENTFIGYATYRAEDNISPIIKGEMEARASAYKSAPNKSVFSILMQKLIIPTNLLFKVSASFPLLTLIVLIILKRKGQSKEYNKLFYLNLLLIITTCTHMFVSAGVGLIIDRYAVEIFVPSLLGLFGTITYGLLIFQNPKLASKQIKASSNKRRKHD